jgi:hypothetical protein
LPIRSERYKIPGRKNFAAVQANGLGAENYGFTLKKMSFHHFRNNGPVERNGANFRVHPRPDLNMVEQ